MKLALRADPAQSREVGPHPTHLFANSRSWPRSQSVFDNTERRGEPTLRTRLHGRPSRLSRNRVASGPVVPAFHGVSDLSRFWVFTHSPLAAWSVTMSSQIR